MAINNLFGKIYSSFGLHCSLPTTAIMEKDIPQNLNPTEQQKEYNKDVQCTFGVVEKQMNFTEFDRARLLSTQWNKKLTFVGSVLSLPTLHFPASKYSTVR